MRAAVLVFPGINRERDMARAFKLICGREPDMVWHAETVLPQGTIMSDERPPGLEGERVTDGRAHGARAADRSGQRVGETPEPSRPLLPLRRDGGSARGVADEQRHVRLDFLVPAVDLAQSPLQPPVRVRDAAPRSLVRERVQESPVRTACAERDGSSGKWAYTVWRCTPASRATPAIEVRAGPTLVCSSTAASTIRCLVSASLSSRFFF